MSTYIDKIPEYKNQAVAGSLLKRRYNGSSFKFENNRPEAIAQRKLQHAANQYVKQQAAPIQQKESEVIQKMGKRNDLKINTKRPAFVGAVKRMRIAAQQIHPHQEIHMAHRLSYKDIREIVLSKNRGEISNLIDNITIPKRNFGDPESGGVKEGDRKFFNAIQQLYDQWCNNPKGKTRKLIQALNSSPYNLRPGDGPRNSSIGERPDAHRDTTKDGWPMTPQSSALLPANANLSSDFMTMAEYPQWESDFGSYRDLAVASVERML